MELYTIDKYQPEIKYFSYTTKSRSKKGCSTEPVLNFFHGSTLSRIKRMLSSRRNLGMWGTWGNLYVEALLTCLLNFFVDFFSQQYPKWPLWKPPRNVYRPLSKCLICPPLNPALIKFLFESAQPNFGKIVEYQKESLSFYFQLTNSKHSV